MLKVYNQKRNFSQSPEPEGKKEISSKNRFVVQEHHATRLHYDFRLELDGVLKSWAVPKGPSMDPSDKRLAVQVEDHPVSYIGFSGTIPTGNYGAGKVIVWDKGTFIPVNEEGKQIPEKQALLQLKKGELKFELKGKKLQGGFVLVRLKKDPKNWLLIKHRDIATQGKNGVSSKHAKPPANNVYEQTDNGRKLQQYIKPMLATPASSAFDDKDWLFEIKWDGYRAIAEWDKKTLKFYSRNGLSFTRRYPVIAEALQTLKHRVVIDGEIVVLNEKGKPDFQLLQQYGDHPGLEIIYYVFDLLMLDGKDVRNLPLTERKALLRKTLPRTKGAVRYCDHVSAKGKAFFKKTSLLGLEGMIAKKADSRYYSGVRTGEWLKIKHQNTREAVIAGFTQPKGSRQHFGALILGEYRHGRFAYMGHTGTGFTASVLKELWQNMHPLIKKHSPFAEDVKVNAPVTWLRPTLVCQVKFAERTKDGLLRQPEYQGLREDKEAAEVIQASEVPANEIKTGSKSTTMKKNSTGGEKEKLVTVNGHPLKLTNLAKIYWPKEKITKGDMMAYYERMAPTILPYLKNRPLSLRRNPDGINDKGFFQKDADKNLPEWIATSSVVAESTQKIVRYIVCNDKATLLYLANLGCIEMNPWNSTVKTPDKPNYLILDIDPADKNTFDQVIETAQVIGELLDKAGATSYCKTSGATGLHVYVPLGAKYPYEQARRFGEMVATLAQQQLPGFTSLERSLSKRGQNIYIDYLQNSKGQTLACAYSLRPVPGAQVSAPLLWKEVKKGLRPSQFTIYNIEERVKKLGDIFYMTLKTGINMAKCLKNLGY